MLHVSEILLQRKDITTFVELVSVVKERAKDERFFRMDIKPPFPDTPMNWEMVLEGAFTGVLDND